MTTQVTLPMTDFAWDPETPLGEILTAYGVALEYQLSLHGSFLGLSDTEPTSYTDFANHLVVVNTAGTALTFMSADEFIATHGLGGGGGGGGSSTFIGLSDTPVSYTVDDLGDEIIAAGKFLAVGPGADRIVFADPPPSTFLDLGQTPNTFAGQAGKYVRVAVGETTLEFATVPGSGVTTFVGLTDVAAGTVLAGNGGKVVQVNPGGTALTLATKVTKFTDLTDAFSPLNTQAGKYVRVNVGGTALEAVALPAAPSYTFLNLTDTPANYTGQNGKMVTVDEPNNKLVFSVVPSGGGGAALSPIQIAVSPETTALTAGAAQVTFRAPKAFTLAGLRASLTEASIGGAVSINIRVGGVSILSSNLVIDNAAKTSVGSAAPVGIATSTISDDAEIKIDVDSAGGGASGLKVTFIPA